MVATSTVDFTTNSKTGIEINQPGLNMLEHLACFISRLKLLVASVGNAFKHSQSYHCGYPHNKDISLKWKLLIILIDGFQKTFSMQSSQFIITDKGVWPHIDLRLPSSKLFSVLYQQESPRVEVSSTALRPWNFQENNLASSLCNGASRK